MSFRMPSQVALWLLCGVAALLVGGRVQALARVAFDDLRYGRPRTMPISAPVGHEDATDRPTMLIAMNLSRHVSVIEIPGGDVAKTRTLAGPYLVGAGEDLTPVRLRLGDINGDNAADLFVIVKQEEIIYINEGGAFRLSTREERAAYAQHTTKGANP